MKPRFFPGLLAAAALFLPQGALAGPDFYGVKMKSEDFARNIMLQENYQTPDFTNERPGTDKRVYAHGYTSTFLGRGRGVSITVYNHSDKPIGTERLMRECVILTNDGKRYDRSQPEMERRRDVLGPGQQATFNISFPGVDLRTQDIRMILFSFGLGETKIFLFPMAAPVPAKVVPAAAAPVKIEKPKAKAKPPKKEKVKEAVPELKKEAPAETSLAAKCVTPIKVMQSFFRSMGEKIGDAAGHRTKEKAPEIAEEFAPEAAPEQEHEQSAVGEVTPAFKDKNIPTNYPEYQDYQRSSQVIEGITYNFRPNFRSVVQEAEMETIQMVTKDRPWSLDKPDQEWSRDWAYRASDGVVPRESAQVVILDPNNIFIVFDAGLEDGVTPNSIVSVLRDGRRVGKAMTNKVRDRITAAVILPEWRTKERIQIGDVVSLAG